MPGPPDHSAVDLGLRLTKQPGAVARARLAFVNRREIPIPARIQPLQVSAWGLFVSPPRCSGQTRPAPSRPRVRRGPPNRPPLDASVCLDYQSPTRIWWRCG